jgi:hypothetical protein
MGPQSGISEARQSDRRILAVAMVVVVGWGFAVCLGGVLTDAADERLASLLASGISVDLPVLRSLVRDDNVRMRPAAGTQLWTGGSRGHPGGAMRLSDVDNPASLVATPDGRCRAGPVDRRG